MKLNFTFLTILGSRTVEPCYKKYEHCLLNELDKPEHFEKWDCSEPITDEWEFFIAFILSVVYAYLMF